MKRESGSEVKMPVAAEEAKRICHAYPAHGSGFVLRVDGNIADEIADIQRRTILAISEELKDVMLYRQDVREYLERRAEGMHGKSIHID